MRRLFLIPVLLTSILGASLSSELMEMARESQDCRVEMMAIEWKNQTSNPVLRTQVSECDRRTTERLKQIIAENGWPRKSAVGSEAARAALLVAQHSSHDAEFLDQVLRLITPLVGRGEVDAEQFALISDHVAVLHGEPQMYATQYVCEWISGGLQMSPSTPIFEPHLLPHRREALGISTHTEYLKKLASLLVTDPETQ